jgi:hypothetical protein
VRHLDDVAASMPTKPRQVVDIVSGATVVSASGG